MPKRKKIPPYIEKFRTYLAGEDVGLMESTQKFYIQRMLMFHKWIRYHTTYSTADDPPSEMTRFDYLEMFRDLMKKGYSQSVRNALRCALSLYRRYITDGTEKDFADLSNLRIPKSSAERKKKPYQYPKYQELLPLRKLIMEGPMHSNPIPLARQRVILELFLSTGMRRNELINAKTENIDGNKLQIYGKRGRWRTVPLSEEAQAAIHEYHLLCDNPKYILDGFGRGGLLNTISAWGILIGRKLRPHDFRHAYITWLLNDKKVNIRWVSKVTGANIKTLTSVYDHPDPDEVADSVYGILK